jgi:hypothetical protein
MKPRDNGLPVAGKSLIMNKDLQNSVSISILIGTDVMRIESIFSALYQALT